MMGLEIVKTIMVLESSVIDRHILQTCFDSVGGYKTIIEEDTEKALEVLFDESVDIDLLILNYVRPVMNGLQIVKLLRANRVTQNLPVFIVTSGIPDDDDRLELEEMGIRIIYKPIVTQNLLEEIKSCFSDRDN